MRTARGNAVVALAVTALLAATAGAPAPHRPPVTRLYVAPWGDDRGPGTLARPFATPARAQRAVRALVPHMASDLTVSLRGGTYRLTGPLRLTPADSGRHGHRVVYQAYGYGTALQEPVTLSGGRPVTGWRPARGRPGVSQADVGSLETRQLYVDGRRAPRAARGGPLPGRLRITATGYTTTSRIPLAWHRPADLEVVHRDAYVEGRCGVAGISRGAAGRTTITMDQPCWRLARALYGAEALTRTHDVENAPDFLGRPGSWYLDRSRPAHHTLLYRPRAGESLSRTEVTAPVLQTLLSGTGDSAAHPVHDIALRGLTFAHATWLAPDEPAGFAAAWSMYMRPGRGGDITALTVPGNVTFRHAEHITLAGDRFTHLGAQGVDFAADSSHNTVTGSVFTDISDGGVALGVLPPATRGRNTGNRVTDNWIHHVGVEYRAASGVWNSATQDTLIAHNQVDHVPYTGILSGPSEDLRGLTRRNRVLGNRVFATNRLLADGGGIYLRGDQGPSYADGALVARNAVTDSAAGVWNVGIYTDDSSNRVTVRDNVVHDYVASIGGCSENWGNRPVRNIRYIDNHWDDKVPAWLPRRPYPGAWPPAPDCGDPQHLHFTDNTLLTPSHPCASDPTCATITTTAGPRPPYRALLGLRWRGISPANGQERPGSVTFGSTKPPRSVGTTVGPFAGGDPGGIRARDDEGVQRHVVGPE
ncbi:right-handed parallel beta-helix repeat-containing protein [Streptomyces sp. NPDC001068]|uniref:right-handed parallel beta-helix repeat-containing protein n=1 Tax=Streptomyces sp. NPDC001068 TaxID=3364544 RepID=UPI0036987F5D